jgi:hypothetical protein
MLKIIKGLLQKILYQPSEIETFILNNNPCNAADIDRLMRVYNNRKGSHYVF